jgi:hypothetical protein
MGEGSLIGSVRGVSPVPGTGAPGEHVPQDSTTGGERGQKVANGKTPSILSGPTPLGRCSQKKHQDVGGMVISGGVLPFAAEPVSGSNLLINL